MFGNSKKNRETKDAEDCSTVSSWLLDVGGRIDDRDVVAARAAESAATARLADRQVVANPALAIPAERLSA